MESPLPYALKTICEAKFYDTYPKYPEYQFTINGHEYVLVRKLRN